MLHLPHELLLHIAAQLDTDSDINALVRTSRQLFSSLNNFLYRRNAQRTSTKGSALIWAAVKNRDATIRRAIDAGARRLDKALCLSAKNGHEAIVKLLLDTGKVDIDSKDKYHRTPLLLAIEERHEAVVKLLLDTGKVDIDAKDGFGHSPLLLAVLNRDKAVIKLLLGTGRVNINEKDDDGRTPLSWAEKAGHEAVVKLLLDMGKVDDGQTPLSWAA